MTWQSRSIRSSRSRSSRARRPYATRQQRKSNGVHWLKWFLVAIILVAIVYLLFFVLPRVEVTIVPETRLVTISEQITLSETARRVDIRDKVIPVAQSRVSGEVLGDFETHGEKDIGDKAEGQVTFYNQTGLALELLIEDGLETIDGLIFTVKAPLTIPAASVSGEGEIIPGQIQAELIALQAGPESNIPPQRIFISSVAPDKQNKIYGETNSPLSGGSSDKIQVASQKDLDEARAELAKQLTQKLGQAIQKDLGSDSIQIAETFALGDEKFSASVELDEEISEFSAELQADGLVYTYSRDDFNELVKDLVLTQLGSGEQLISESPAEGSFAKGEREFKDGKLTLQLEAKWPASQRIDLANLKQEILGKREADARRILLREPTVSDVRFNWITAISRKVPKIASHVAVGLKAN